MNNTFYTRIQNKIDTLENFTTNNPLILKGETVLVKDGDKIKIKVGIEDSAYFNDVPYVLQNPIADWTQNDSTSSDYIKNRTHWTEGESVEVLPETELILVGEDGGRQFAMQDVITGIEVGDTLTVSYNGVKYICVAELYEEVSDDGVMQGVMFGDLSIVSGSPSGAYPFIAVVPSAEGAAAAGVGLIVIALDSPASLVFGISNGAEIVHKLHKKYLPDEVLTEDSDVTPLLNFDTNTFQLSKKGVLQIKDGVFASVASVNAKPGQIMGYGKKVTIDGVTYQTGYDAEIFNDSNNKAVGNYSHAEGRQTVAIEVNSHAEGYLSVASGHTSHAEGSATASGNNSHAEGGRYTTASGSCSHAEGFRTTASGSEAHSEGRDTVASGFCSHAEGCGTIASEDGGVGYYPGQHVQGTYNIADGKSLFIIGNGTSDTARSNAHTVDRNGNAWYAGDVYIGGTGKEDGEKLVKQSDLPTIDNTLTNSGQVADAKATGDAINALKAEMQQSLADLRAEILAEILGGEW